MPFKKKRLSTKKKALPLMIAFGIILAYVGLSLSSQDNRIPTPSVSSFKHEAWMSFIPADSERFRLLNIAELAKFEGLFTDAVILSIPEPQLNISVNEVPYGLEVETQNNVVANILGVNVTTSERAAKALEGKGLLSILYRNATLYKVKPPAVSRENTAWISVFNGAVLYSEGNETALQAVKSVVDASTRDFFSNDAFKVGYLLACEGKKYLAFSFFRFEENDLKVRWAMLSAYGSSEITKRNLFYLNSKDDVAAKYQDVVKNLLSRSRHVYTSDNFIIGDFVYSSNDIRTVIMGM